MKITANLVSIALDCPSVRHFLCHGLIATSPIFDADDYDEAYAYLRRVYSIAHGGVPAILADTGMTQTALAKRFGIPLRSVQNWANGISTPPSYVICMMVECLIR